MGYLDVVLYKAESDVYRHWAIHIEGPGKKHKIYEVDGESPNFEFNVRTSNPQRSRRVKQVIKVTDSLDDFDKAIEVLKDIEIHNDIAHWNCQDWVLEALEKLKDEGIIPEDGYERAELRLKALAGANEVAD